MTDLQNRDEAPQRARGSQGTGDRFAIVGYAVRLPGAPDADAFWDVLQQGRDALSEVPPDRWDVDEFYDPDPDAPGKIVSRRAGFIEDVTGFDAPFFGLSNRETMLIDPQHRILLETAWQAVEHSGTAPSALANTKTGVFMGLGTHDYLGLISEQLSYEEIEAYVAIGTSSAAGAGRISYGLGLQGPAVSVDTACSSSLVAVHQACQSLRFGECDLALAGGVNVLLSAKTAMTFSHAHMLAPDGRCKTFDAAADGYVRGEGCGVVVVKRLEDAIRDGDRIRAVIRGSAVNQDGASGGLTVPNGVAQQRVIAEALQCAGVSPGEVGYLEAHGTGTSLGDPIEVQAAGAALGKGRDADRPLLIGSVKTNIGHLEAAAGIAGLIKVILSFEHEVLPKHLNFSKPSPHIPWDRLPVRVVDEAVPWARDGRPRIAGISSFGFSGTNAHVILEEAPEASHVAAPATPSDDRRFSLLPLSARSPAALAELAKAYGSWLAAHPDASLADVCLTAGSGRSHFEHRAAIVVNSMESAREQLAALADERPAPGLLRGECTDRPKTAWLFTGQGSQYAGMARELFETEPVFAETMTQCAAAVADVLEKPLLDVIFDPDGDDTLRLTSYAQPALFAVEMGLARLWQSWGFEPDVVIGHSVGQYTAACVAGVFSLEDGAQLLAERGRLFGSLPDGGRMVAVFAAAERVESLTDEFPSLSVAAYNGANTVLSGPVEDLERAVAGLEDDGVRCDWLDTSHAFHSALLDPVLDEFESYANRFTFGAPQRTLVCNRTGAALGRSAKLDGAYWRRHARQPVEFAKSVHTLADLHCTMLLEIGPQPILTAAALRAWPDPATAPRAVASMRKNIADHRQITEALANAYIVGHRPDFGALAGSARKLDLPTYPFQHRQYWFKEQRVTPAHAPAQVAAARTETVRLLEDGRFDELAALLGGNGNQQPVEMLKQLAAQHNQERSVQSIADSRYEIRWEKSAASSAKAGEGSGWLLIGDDAGAAQPVVDALTAGGHRHRIIGLPVSDADEERLATALRAAAAEEPELRIVLLAALDSDTATSTRSLLRMQHRVLGGTRRLFRAAATAELRAPIWLVTRGAQRVTKSDAVSPVQTCLWGFGRAAALEYPRLWGGLVDLPAAGAPDDGVWSRLIDRMVAAPRGSASSEDQIALREQAVYVPRLTRRSGQPAAKPLALRDDATYLVTGGLGGVGMEIAGYLAAHGARHLVLTSRRTPGDAAQQRIQALHDQHGCDVRVITADVADLHDVARLVSTIQAELPPLAGIVHAAGEIGNTPLQTLDDAEIDRVFAGKVWGAWHLSEAIADMKLDFFLCTASISGVWGSGGQSAYSAANAFLDGLAWQQREHGYVSVNFGPWSAAGMADEAARAQLDKRGVRPLSPADALAGMADVMGGSSPQGVVAKIDWASFLPLYQMAGKRGFLTELQQEVPDSAPELAASGTTQLVERLTAAPVQQRKKLVVDYLRDAVAEVTRIDPAEIREEAGLFDLGMDSLMAVELRRRLERAVGKELPATLAMDYPRITDVANFLINDVLSLSAPAAAQAVPVAAPVTQTTGRTDEPIAIVAVACRFPGAPDPESYWELLSGGVDAIREIPDDRFDVDEYYDPDPEAPGKIYTRYGGYLDKIDGFDPEFFGISPREAVWMDPQQRLMLEIAWEGLERAGYSPAGLRGSRTGVFVGVAANEYSQLLNANSVETIEAHFITGNALNVIAGRVAFALGLEGPAMAVDTACSASLVAVHQACQALHSGDCDMALAGGVNVLVSPASIVATARARMLAADGRCKTFDARANGYARSEGCGILVLKRLSDAERDGDQICAVIRGSAVNQDGASSGLTVPNGGAQQRLIAATLARAGLVGGDVDYLEAHGTGTSLGDPIEVQAAAAAYGVGRDPNRPLLIGSVKTNIGHLESAAGIAGLIKVVLSLQHGVLPQILHFENPSPHIPWDSLPVRVVDKPIPWHANGRPRRAGTSSFGFSGTNAHVLIEEAPPATAVAQDVSPGDTAEPESGHDLVNVLPLSARSPQALAALAQRYAGWLDQHPDVDIADVCFTAAVGRSHFEHRAALVVESVEGARELLHGLAENRLGPGAMRGECGDPPKTAWLFTGQGSQYPGMARELFDTEPVFAETVRRCAEAVDGMLPRPLLEVLFDTSSDAGETLRHTSFAQPALFAVEMGLARLWQSWGIEPDVVLGHSVGQYAAACVAGVFSLEDGARLIAERGRLFGSLPEGGRMVAVFADAQRVERAAEEFPHISVAAYNGPNTVLSGPGADLEDIVAKLSADGMRCTWLDTSHAFHSELLEPVLDEFESYAKGFEFAVPTMPLVCNRTGALLTAETPLDAQYWRRHSRQPVQFAESVRTVAALGCSVLMEIGPQPVLTNAAAQAWPDSSPAPRAIVCLRKDADARRQMAEALAGGYVSGHRPAFAALYHRPRHKLALPTYAFQRRRFWPKNADIRGIDGQGAAGSGILGSAKDLASGDTVYTSRWSVNTQPWLAHHVIYGTVVVPGATYATMALAAVGTPAQVRNVFFYEPIILPDKHSREVQLTMHPAEDEGGWTFQVHSRPYGERDAEWSLNADGRVVAGADDALASEPTESIDAACERLGRTRPQQLFDTFADMDLMWGPTWSNSLKSLWAGDGEAVGDIAIGEELAEQLGSEPVHPVLLDLCTGVAFPAFPAILEAAEGEVPDLFLPLRYGRVVLREKLPKRFYCRARWQSGGSDSETQVFDLDFVDRDGRELGGIREFTVKRAPREALLRGLGGDAARNLYTFGWQEVPPPASGSGAGDGTWLIAGFDELAAKIQRGVALDRAAVSGDAEAWKRLLAEASDRGAPVSGIVWRSNARPDGEESSAELAARLQGEIDRLLTVVQTLQAQQDLKLTGGLWIVTERAVATEPGEPVDPVQSALWGFGRSVITEQPGLHCRLVDCDGFDQAAQSLAGLLGTPADEPELALRQGKYLVPRLLPWARSGHLPVPRGGDYILEPTERGAIDNLHLVATEVPPPSAGQVQIRVEAAGLNFRDVLNVLGLYPGDPGRVGGGDLCGVVTELGAGVSGFEVGQRVFGFMPGGFATRVNVPAQFLAPVPHGVSAVGAATIPAGALTTRLAFDWAKLGPGDRVLIHAASGGVGLAAIQMAQQRGAIVFATASTYKRATLRKMGVEHIYDSRTTDFADQILADTGGAGVDVVLNSLTNEGFIAATVRATAQGGRFAEIAKRDIWTREQMAAARPDIDYEIIALDACIEHEPERTGKLLAEVADSMARGELAPLAVEVYPVTEAKTAFRRMQQARHIGKIVLQMPKPLQPRGDRSYLITGGLGALGLHTAAHLAQLGAGDIVLTSRSTPDAEAQREIDEITERYRCRIHTFAADVGDEAQITELIGRIREELPPLAGVAHLAGVLDDALLSEQSPERFRKVLSPKAIGGWHLHRLTKNDDLDFFIVYSSASSVLGSPGQANYAAANALLDGLVADRQAQGLPATGVNWGPWAKGGMATSHAARANLSAQGLIPLEPTAALTALDEIVAHGTGQATVIKANWQRAAKGGLGAARPAILDHVLPSAAGASAGDSELLRQLHDVPEAERGSFLTEFLRHEVQNFLRLAQPPAATSRFLELGTDSLMAVEFSNRLIPQFGGAFTINATAVFDYPTIGSLAEYLAAQVPEPDGTESDGAHEPAH